MALCGKPQGDNRRRQHGDSERTQHRCVLCDCTFRAWTALGSTKSRRSAMVCLSQHTTSPPVQENLQFPPESACLPRRGCTWGCDTVARDPTPTSMQRVACTPALERATNPLYRPGVGRQGGKPSHCRRAARLGPPIPLFSGTGAATTRPANGQGGPPSRRPRRLPDRLRLRCLSPRAAARPTSEVRHTGPLQQPDSPIELQ